MCYNCFELLKKREFCFTEQIINIDRMENAVALFGSFDGNIKLIEKEFNVRVTCRDSELKVEAMPKTHRRPARLLKACCSSSTVVKHFPNKISATAFRLSMKAVRTK